MTFIPFPLTSQIQCGLLEVKPKLKSLLAETRKIEHLTIRVTDEAFGDLKRENNSSYDLEQKYCTLAKYLPNL